MIELLNCSKGVRGIFSEFYELKQKIFTVNGSNDSELGKKDDFL